MRIRYGLLLGILLLGTINQKATSKHSQDIRSVVEVNVLDYPFMKEIANFILHTDQDKLFTQYNKPQYEADYRFDLISEISTNKKSKSLSINGSYSIEVSLSPCAEQYLFTVNSVRFHSDYNLVPYFVSCNIKKIDIEAFKNGDAFWYYFWSFEVKDGKVIDAVYFYCPVDDGFDKYDVYDLIHKEYIPYKVWNARIHPSK